MQGAYNTQNSQNYNNKVKCSHHNKRSKSNYANNKNKFFINPFPHKKDLTVILDLDNTLISSFIFGPDSTLCDFLFTLQSDPEMQMIGVVKRPNVDSFLMSLSSFATIYLFTAADKEYASKIVNQIDPIGKYFSKVFTRENCIHTKDNKYIKDYSICGTNMSRTLIVDDIPENFKEYESNGIQVLPYKGGLSDNDLVRVFYQIIRLSSLQDVRTGISN